MRQVFADTFYFLALLNSTDAQHPAALAAARKPGRHFLTTEYVLVELGDAFHHPEDREDYHSVIRLVTTNAAWEVIPSSRDLFQRVFRYRDKDWQMTDCISFAALKQRHLREALTGDRHFVQAGFKALLL